MRRIDVSFLVLATLCLIVGVSMGIVMGILHDFQLAPVHAHLNLLGWASLALFGLSYKSYPALARSRLALVEDHAQLPDVETRALTFDRPARALLVDKVGGDATGVHATGVAIHNMVSGLEAMKAAFADREARERLSVAAAVAKAVVAPRQVVRQPTVAGSSSAGGFSADTLVLLGLEKANKADPGYDTAFMDGTWSECPARRWVPALYAAIWRRAVAGGGSK